MLDYIIAAAVIILAGTLFDVPFWCCLLILTLFLVGWSIIGEEN